MPSRQEFLSQIWMPYPPSLPKTKTVGAQHIAPGDLLGGRLKRAAGGDWNLVSGGNSIALRFSSAVEWLRPQRVSNCDFSPLLLGDGDLVCVRLQAVEANQSYLADGVLLLVPSAGTFAVSPAFTSEISRQWMQLLTELRGFFRSRDFIETQTPTLVPSPGTEPFLDPFVTQWEFGSERKTLYLPTSPEFHLKKLLAAGWVKVFEIKSCFRNGELGPHHQPEFTMLEWYRGYSDLEAIAQDCEDLLLHLGAPKLERTSMSALFAQAFAGFQLTPRTSLDELASVAKSFQTRVEPDDTWDEVFFRLFLEHIEPRLGEHAPLLVSGYPPSQAAQARLREDGFADRFEIYWRGMEIANAFHELNDPAEAASRLRKDVEDKRALGKPVVPIDEAFLAALNYGLPPSGGIALGVERLFMALNAQDAIENCRAFPVQLKTFNRRC